MDESKKDKLKVLTRCIQEAKRLLKKAKEEEEQYKIEQDLAVLTTGQSSLQESQVLSKEELERLVTTINKYYYRRMLVLIPLFLLVSVLAMTLRLPGKEPRQRLPTGGVDVEDLQDVAKEEYVEIPGYQDLEVSKKQPFIQLKNLEENSVYLQYNILQGEETLYQSILVEPGNKCDKWNAYESLGIGTHKVVFFIKTFDVETQAECNSTTQKVKVTVKE